MRLIDHIGRDLTGISNLSLRSFTWHVETIARLAGSGRAGARLMGVAESTFRGWRHGAVPRGGQRHDTVKALARTMAVQSNPTRFHAAMVGDADALLTVKGTFRVSGDTRSRVIYPGRYIPNSVIRRALGEWAQGLDDRAESTVIRAIDTYYQPFAFDKIEWAGFTGSRDYLPPAPS